MNLSISSKESLSRSRAMRSRAVILPSAFCRARRSFPPPSSAARFSSSKRSMRSEAVTLATQTLLDYGHFFPILQELLDSLVCKRMLQKLIEYFCGHRADVCTHQPCLHHMDRIANGSHKNLCCKFVIVEDRHDVLDQFHSVLADVVQTANERADEIGTCLRGHDGLRC